MYVVNINCNVTINRFSTCISFTHIPHRTDGHGGIYYYNFNTHESTWEHPCDTFYQNMLQKEREKKRSLRKGEINTKQEKGGHLGLKKAPLLGPVSHGGKPEVSL